MLLKTAVISPLLGLVTQARDVSQPCYQDEYDGNTYCTSKILAEYECYQNNHPDYIYYEQSTHHKVNCQEARKKFQLPEQPVPNRRPNATSMLRTYKLNNDIFNYVRINNKFIIPMEFTDRIDLVNVHKNFDKLIEMQNIFVEKNTCIKAVWRTGYYQVDGSDYIAITDDGSGSCAAAVGNMQGQENFMTMGSTCIYPYTHELGHALGYLHEQSKANRGGFQRLDWRILSSSQFWYDNYKKDDELYGDNDHRNFDYGSELHYQTFFFNQNGPNRYYAADRIGTPYNPSDRQGFWYDQQIENFKKWSPYWNEFGYRGDSNIFPGQGAFSRVDVLTINEQYNCYDINIPTGQKLKIVNKADPSKFTYAIFDEDFVWTTDNAGTMATLANIMSNNNAQLIFVDHLNGPYFNLRLETESSRKCYKPDGTFASCNEFAGFENDEYLYEFYPVYASSFVKYDRENPVDLRNPSSWILVNEDESWLAANTNYNKGTWIYSENGINYDLIPTGDMCQYQNGFCSDYCENLTNQGRNCYCSEGYEIGPDGRTCQDINECETGVCGTAKCYNRLGDELGWGGYKCYCDWGYDFDPETKSCVLINDLKNRQAQYKRIQAPNGSCLNKWDGGLGYRFTNNCENNGELFLVEYDETTGHIKEESGFCFEFNQVKGECAPASNNWFLVVSLNTCDASVKAQQFTLVDIGNGQMQIENTICNGLRPGENWNNCLVYCDNNWGGYDFSLCIRPCTVSEANFVITDTAIPTIAKFEVENPTSDYFDGFGEIDLNEFCDQPYERMYKSAKNRELICVNHDNGSVFYYDYSNGLNSVENKPECVGNTYDVEVFSSTQLGLTCINKEADNQWTKWCRISDVHGFPGGKILMADWDNDGIDDFMCYEFNGNFKMAYGNNQGSLEFDPVLRQGHYMMGWNGQEMDYVDDRWYVYAQDKNGDGKMDVVAQSTAYGGKMLIMYQINDEQPNKQGSFAGNAMNVCSATDSATDTIGWFGGTCLSYWQQGCHWAGCDRTCGKCKNDGVATRRPYFETNPDTTVEYTSANNVGGNTEFCINQHQEFINLDISSVEGNAGDPYCFDYQQGRLQNFYKNTFAMFSFCKSGYEFDSQNSIEMPDQKSGFFWTEQINNQVTFFCGSRINQKIYYSSNVDFTMTPNVDATGVVDVCLDSTCEFCHPLTAECYCPDEKFVLVGDICDKCQLSECENCDPVDGTCFCEGDFILQDNGISCGCPLGSRVSGSNQCSVNTCFCDNGTKGDCVFDNYSSCQECNYPYELVVETLNGVENRFCRCQGVGSLSAEGVCNVALPWAPYTAFTIRVEEREITTWQPVNGQWVPVTEFLFDKCSYYTPQFNIAYSFEQCDDSRTPMHFKHSLDGQIELLFENGASSGRCLVTAGDTCFNWGATQTMQVIWYPTCVSVGDEKLWEAIKLDNGRWQLRNSGCGDTANCAVNSNFKDPPRSRVIWTFSKRYDFKNLLASFGPKIIEFF